jgi:hypothetical protein
MNLASRVQNFQLEVASLQRSQAGGLQVILCTLTLPATKGWQMAQAFRRTLNAFLRGYIE